MPEPLTYDDGPLVWVDCEMTGLDFLHDKIIEIAVIITNGRLEPVDEGINYIINTPKDVLDNMNEWCVNQHGKSGLTQACLDSPYTYEQVTQKVLEYIQKWIPERGAGLLAGSTVHADMRGDEAPIVPDRRCQFSQGALQAMVSERQGTSQRGQKGRIDSSTESSDQFGK
ncbi:oligoribonuclease, mitochondrial [Kwoniella heveanensis BCC8398]|uniref:Oligoribonuclease, mitochondrial n=1 Tax=Kwoniella heveanensis BCC8398 TaxID=1296120 RepID=A0A1B9GPP7_9TREE|nr:oligoribonuclease, mitochondrial [Kwoniella heveanensis BCC8398]